VLFGRLFRVPVVIAHEQTWSYQGQIHRVVLDALIGRLSSVFVAVSSADRERMIKRERVPAERIVVVPNAYIPRADSPPGDLRAELGLSLETPVIGTVAQLRPQKALQVLLMAVADIRASHPGVRLVIAGDGECRQDLERLAKELGIADHTHFLGIREDICTVLGGFDVAALSSDFEGTPLFVVECMTHGTPLVATRVGGLPDLVEDGRSAILVPPRDPSALGAALNSLLSDQELRRRIGDQARERSQEFTLERIADRFESLYESLLARAAG
jgi:glycosyltransferase involved in cell wall biosynthesis